MSENTKKRMTLIREEEDSSDTNIQSQKSQYRSTHRRSHSKRGKEAYKKKHPIKYFFLGTKERRLRTAFSIAIILIALIILFLYPLLFKPFSNKSASPGAICADSNCSKEVARSGDTNFCNSHSSKCLGCGCYVDTYATYCRDCATLHESEK